MYTFSSPFRRVGIDCIRQAQPVRAKPNIPTRSSHYTLLHQSPPILLLRIQVRLAGDLHSWLQNPSMYVIISRSPSRVTKLPSKLFSLASSEWAQTNGSYLCLGLDEKRDNRYRNMNMIPRPRPQDRGPGPRCHNPGYNELVRTYILS